MRWGRRLGVALGLLVLGASYFGLGILLPLEWVDEGHVVYPSWRVSQGALPYREFGHLYAPSSFFVHAFLFQSFGPDLQVLRAWMLVLKLAGALCVYAAARRMVPSSYALAAFALTLVVWGVPWPPATTPYANYYGLTLGLLGLLVYVARAPHLRSASLLAGICFGVAATFKQTTGLFACLALALYLLTEAAPSAPKPSARQLFWAQVVRGLTLLASLTLLLLYMAPRNDAWNLFALLVPSLVLVTRIAWWEWRGGLDSASRVEGARALLFLAGGVFVPLAACGLYFHQKGLLPALLFNSVWGLPALMDWWIPIPNPGASMLFWAGLGLGGFGSVVLARRAAAGRAPAWASWVAALLGLLSLVGLYQAVWRSADYGDWWFWYSADLYFVLALAVVWVGLWQIFRPRQGLRAPTPRSAGERSFGLLACFATTSLLFLYPAGDIWHLLHVLPAFLPLLARELWSFRAAVAVDAAPRANFAATGVVGALLIALALPAAHDLWSEGQRRAGDVHAFDRATGVHGGGPEVQSAAQLLLRLDSPELGERAIFALSGRQLLYFLSGRVSPLEEFEIGLYLLRSDALSEKGVLRLLDEEKMIRALQASRPLVVDDAYDDASERILARLPRVSRYLRTHYEPILRIGGFEVRDLQVPLSGNAPRAREP